MRLNIIECLMFASVVHTKCVTGRRRLRSSHNPLVFPRDESYTCSTPLHQPGMCVPIEHCPQLRRVGLRRLPKYICGFEHDTPLLCCESSTMPPTSTYGLNPPPPPITPPPPHRLPPETVRPDLVGPVSPHLPPAPIPVLCTRFERNGRRWRSCWYLALQRVDYPDGSSATSTSAQSSPSSSNSSAGSASSLRPSASEVPRGDNSDAPGPESPTAVDSGDLPAFAPNATSTKPAKHDSAGSSSSSSSSNNNNNNAGSSGSGHRPNPSTTGSNAGQTTNTSPPNRPNKTIVISQ